ncbi:MAG: Smr/MutS family protein, partial [Bacteroidota bacterium]
DLEKNRKEIIEKAKEEAQEILNNSNRLIENTIREIKEAEADKAKTKESRHKFEEEKEKILMSKEKTAKQKQKKKKPSVSHSPKQTVKKAPEKDYELEKGEIHIGDTVKISGQSGSGEVISMSKNKAEVSFGQMKMQVPVAKLEKIKTTKKQEKKTQGNYHSIMEDMQHKSQNFSSTLDIRGVKADEALTKLMNFIDDATLLGVYDLRILHGKGHGVLRSVVRDYLAGLDEVKNFHDEHVERGGQGVTIVRLK